MNSEQQRRLVQEDLAEAATPVVLDALADLRGASVLVTGGTGFVGTWMAEWLTHLNDEHGFGTRVHLLARHADAFRERSPHLTWRADVHVHEGDIRNVTELPGDVTWIVHAAGTPDSRTHATDPLRTLHTFAGGTDALLRAAVRLERVNRIAHVSSGLIYGPQPLDLERIPEGFRGGADCSSVASAYGEAKRVAETYCAAYRSEHRLPTLNVRPFAFLGPHQYLDRPWAVNNFLQDALRGGPIRILGNAETVRSYLYPSDLVVWLSTMLVHGRPGHDYNLGSPEAVTLGDLAQRIAGASPRRPRVQSSAPGQRPAHPSRFVPDTSQVASELGLRLTVDLDEAIRRTMAWHLAGDAERSHDEAVSAPPM
jgi:dTDP-glucose 4,6-dehydratase